MKNIIFQKWVLCILKQVSAFLIVLILTLWIFFDFKNSAQWLNKVIARVKVEFWEIEFLGPM